MFAKLARLAESWAIESRRAMPGAMRLVHSGDNQRTTGPTTVRQQNRRQALVCRWHSGLGNGRLECSWHIEPDDDCLGKGERADARPVAARRLPARQASSPICGRAA
jgi:hypothetical protein